MCQVIIDSQPLTMAVLTALLFGEPIGLVQAYGLVLGVTRPSASRGKISDSLCSGHSEGSECEFELVRLNFLSDVRDTCSYIHRSDTFKLSVLILKLHLLPLFCGFFNSCVSLCFV